MASKKTQPITYAPLTYEEAANMVDAVSNKVIETIQTKPASSTINLNTITTIFQREARNHLLANSFKNEKVTYADIMNGTMDDFRIYIGHVNTYVNSLLMRKIGCGTVSIYKAVYSGGYEAIKASGIVDRFGHKPDECFNDVLLKPFFVAGCMNAIKAEVKKYELRKLRLESMYGTADEPATPKMAPDTTTKTIPALAQPQMPPCANYRPATHAATTPTKAVSAPAM